MAAKGASAMPGAKIDSLGEGEEMRRKRNMAEGRKM